ncbi:uncharacterized protein E0L32_010472, partial [Thyridium curvatum]
MLATTLVVPDPAGTGLVEAAPDAPPHLLDNLAPGQQLGEHDDHVLLALHDDDEVVPHLEAAEGLVDEHVADLGRRYEAHLAHAAAAAGPRGVPVPEPGQPRARPGPVPAPGQEQRGEAVRRGRRAGLDAQAAQDEQRLGRVRAAQGGEQHAQGRGRQRPGRQDGGGAG